MKLRELLEGGPVRRIPGSKILGKDSNWIVREFKTFEALKKIASGTPWCVKGKKHWEEYKRYTPGGTFKVLVNRKTGKKWLSFWDSKDFDSQVEIADEKGEDLWTGEILKWSKKLPLWVQKDMGIIQILARAKIDKEL